VEATYTLVPVHLGARSYRPKRFLEYKKGGCERRLGIARAIGTVFCAAAETRAPTQWYRA